LLIGLLLYLCGDIEKNPGPGNVLKLSLLNARSIKSVGVKHNKLAQLESLLFIETPNVLVLTKTWLNSNIRNQEVCSVEYDIFRRDRTTDRGGGVAVLYKNTLDISRQDGLENELDATSEIVICEQKLVNGKIM
jgi:hypothetical protein